MYLFEEGDEIAVTLQPDVQEALRDALGVDYEEIRFYFIEIEDESDTVILSAESDKKFAILKCPYSVIDNTEVQEQMDAFLKQILINHALDTGNKGLFNAVMNLETSESEIEYEVFEGEDE